MTKYRETMRLSAMGQLPAGVAAAPGCSDSAVRRAIKATGSGGIRMATARRNGSTLVQAERRSRTLLHEGCCDQRLAPCSATTFSNGYADGHVLMPDYAYRLQARPEDEGRLGWDEDDPDRP